MESQETISHSELMSASEVCSMFSVSNRTLSRWLENGKFPLPVRVGGTRRWRRSELDLFIDSKGDGND